MKKIELEIIALSHSITQSNSYAVVLGEVNGLRRLPIVIGGFEAQAIAVALERMKPTRPLTHDLMKNFMMAFQIDLHEVVISRLHEGVFYSQLLCSSENDTIEIDSRTSDALALAVRFGCPIYTYESVLENASNVTEMEETKAGGQVEAVSVEGNDSTSEDLHANLSGLTMEELQQKLAEVLENEDYLQAIAIRDEISSRNQSGSNKA